MSSTDVARRIVSALVAHGVTDVIVCPGSRDAPLSYALAAADEAGMLHLTVRLDERSAGFVALGLGKVGRPAAVVTTSGTAVANLHPAVAEADAAGVPMIVISADRPAQMWHTGANQTTVQTGIFGPAPRWQLSVPAGFPADDRLDAVVLRAVSAARGTLTDDPGPVHLNVSFDDPLVPDSPWQPTHDAESPRAVLEPPPLRPAVPLTMPVHTVVVAGDGAGPRARELAEEGGWPLLAEPTSQARCGDNALTDYQTLLTGPLASEVEGVLVLGHPTLSRPVSRLLTGPGITVLTDRARWTDVAGVARAVHLPVQLDVPERDETWVERWKRADREGVSPSIKQSVCATIWQASAQESAPALVIGASDVIRSFDRHAAPAAIPAQAYANRGLAGIDGTMSTAMGIAMGTGRPVRVVLGDLTFAHDAMALLQAAGQEPLDLQVIVLDDHGGAIFAGLEHARAPRPMLQRFFLTPQNLDVTAFAQAVGVPCTTVDLTATGSDGLAPDPCMVMDDVLGRHFRGTSLVEVHLPTV